MSHNEKAKNRQAYTVGWICALTTEFVAACELLDDEFPPLASLSHDSNNYTLGQIGDHYVVVACLPKGNYGTASAASVAKDMLRSFESIRIGLMVGIAGGAPSLEHDIRLGDVVVGCPAGGRGAVFPYRYGKAVQDKEFDITGGANNPPTLLLTALSKLETIHTRKGHQIAATVREMVRKNDRLREAYRYPGAEKDRLYTWDHTLEKEKATCSAGCDRAVPPEIERSPRSPDPNDPCVHYGTIASADQLVKDATLRDKISQQYGVICFEMEAAGLSNDFPCIIIRGICDYSDSHKNDEWQGYAAATAASYAKELLEVIPSPDVEKSQPATEVVSGTAINANFEMAQNELALDPVSKPQSDSVSNLGNISAPQAKASKDPQQNLHNALDRHEFTGGIIPGHRIKITRSVMTEVQQWLEKRASSTLWVQGQSFRSQPRVTLALARHVKAELVNKRSCRVMYFCNSTPSEVPIADFLTFVNRQLAGYDQNPAASSRQDRNLTTTSSTCHELRHHLESAFRESTFPVFGIFHNLGWLGTSGEDDKIALREILDAFERTQKMGSLKLLYTTNGGTTTGVQTLEAAVAEGDRIALSGSGPCPLTQLRIPDYEL